MNKKLLILFFSAITALCVMAQLNGDGYYRVQNYKTARWAYLTDNHAPVDQTATKIDLKAIKLFMNPEKYFSDPSTVIYIESVGNNQYDIKGQGTSVYSMTNYYLKLNLRSEYGAYRAYGSYAGVARVLTDPVFDLTIDESYMSDRQDGDYSFWYIKPVSSSSSDCYFGIKPTVTDNQGRHFAAMFCDFPYQLNSDGKAFYVSKVDSKRGLAVYKELPNRKVSGKFASFQQVGSTVVANNKVEVGVTGAQWPDGNALKGVYFDRDDKNHSSYTAYDAQTMRVFGLLADGSIGFIIHNDYKLPANQSYLVVPKDSPAEFKLVTEQEYQDILDNEPVPAESVVLSNTQLTLLVGASQQLTATVLPENATDKTVAWSTSNSAVATVDQEGRVTAKSVGSADITASCGDVKATCNVTVKPVEAESVTLSQTSLSLLEGESKTLTATVAPANTTDKTIEWSSSNAAVAKVDSNGKVTAVKVGTAVITAKCGSASANCSVTVNPVEAQSIVLSHDNLTLAINESRALTATVKPTNTSDKTLTWTSSDESVATVSASGMVVAKAVGQATITVTCGNASASCNVTVVKMAQSIVWNQNLAGLEPGDEVELNAYATSGLDVSYAIVSGTECATLTGNALKIVADGEFVVEATQPGDDAYAAADPVCLSVVVTGIHDAAADNAAIKVASGKILNAGSADLVVYNMQGQAVYAGNDKELRLTPGTYIVNCAGKTLKVVVQ